MVEKKEVDYKKKYKRSERLRKKDKEQYMNHRESLIKRYNSQLDDLKGKIEEQEAKQIQIRISPQTWSSPSLLDARETAKKLIDLGFWFFELREK